LKSQAFKYHHEQTLGYKTVVILVNTERRFVYGDSRYRLLLGLFNDAVSSAGIMYVWLAPAGTYYGNGNYRFQQLTLGICYL